MGSSGCFCETAGLAGFITNGDLGQVAGRRLSHA
jgi:hypothetical protein